MLHLPSMDDMLRARRMFKELRHDIEQLSPRGRARLISYMDEQAPGMAHALREILDEHDLGIEG